MPQHSDWHLVCNGKIMRSTTNRVAASRGHGAGKQRPTLRSTSPRSRTILLVEDEVFVRDVAGEILRSEGFRVLSVATAQEALSKFRMYRSKVDLLLTDVVLPDWNGNDLANELAAARPDLKVIFMSGYPETNIAKRSRRSRALYLSKPFCLTSLLEKIQQVFPERPARAARNAACNG